MSLNLVVLVGNLGKDPEFQQGTSGIPYARFPLATNHREKTEAGGWEDGTEWHSVVLFGRNAEIANQYLKKGRQVCIQGRVETKRYEADGQAKYFTRVIGDRLTLLSDKAETPTQTEEESPKEDGLPF